MTDKPKNPIEIDTQPAYDPPQALRMGDIHAGSGGGVCNPSGSGDTGYCTTGNNAAGDGCIENGNSAFNCYQQGVGAEISGDN